MPRPTTLLISLPPSEVICPPSNRPITSRENNPCNANSAWLHSVIGKSRSLPPSKTFGGSYVYARLSGSSHLCSVESRNGAVRGRLAVARLRSPLIKPDVPISGIRLSDWFHL